MIPPSALPSNVRREDGPARRRAARGGGEVFRKRPRWTRSTNTDRAWFDFLSRLRSPRPHAMGNSAHGSLRPAPQPRPSRNPRRSPGFSPHPRPPGPRRSRGFDASRNVRAWSSVSRSGASVNTCQPRGKVEYGCPFGPDPMEDTRGRSCARFEDPGALADGSGSEQTLDTYLAHLDEEVNRSWKDSSAARRGRLRAERLEQVGAVRPAGAPRRSPQPLTG